MFTVMSVHALSEIYCVISKYISGGEAVYSCGLPFHLNRTIGTGVNLNLVTDLQDRLGHSVAKSFFL
jgi:hypothetical protein